MLALRPRTGRHDHDHGQCLKSRDYVIHKMCREVGHSTPNQPGQNLRRRHENAMGRHHIKTIERAR
jgi:hypothetical protein